MMLPRLAGLLVPVLLLAGCGGGSEDTSPAEKTLRTYFDDIATQTPGSLRGAVNLAAPGSPAAAYATYLEASTRAAQDAGQAIDKARKTADRTAAGFRFCQGSETKHVCFDYTKITRKHGLVSDFSVNGKPIADRLAVGTNEATAFEGADAQATFVAAYQTTARGDLLVVVRVAAGTGAALGGVKGSYQSAGAAPTAATQSFGPTALDDGATAHYMFAFPKTEVGGTLMLSATGAPGGHAGTVALHILSAFG